jgi:hypothetical protein
MIVAELFALIAAATHAPAEAATPAASSMAAQRRLEAVVVIEDAPVLEDLKQPAIFTKEGRERAISTPPSPGSIT